MQGGQSKTKTDAGTMRITFPADPAIGLRAGQELVVNGIRACLREADDGQLEIDDPAFIEQLFRLGFHIGANDRPQDLERILKNIPPQHRQAFMDGFNSK